MIAPRSPLDSALGLIEFGIRVSPAYTLLDDGSCSCRNPCCRRPAKHPHVVGLPQHGTADPDTARAWWRQHPDTGVVAWTGRCSTLWVIDVDSDRGGLQSLAQLQRHEGNLPLTRTTRTGGGGLHFYWSGLLPLPSGRDLIAPGVDVRGEGGYVIAPPSWHRSRNQYRWESEGPIVPAPDWLIRRVQVCGRVNDLGVVP